MSAKDKTFQEKLKQFFRINRGGTGNIKGRVDFSLTADIEKDLGPETPINHRTKVIKELSEAVMYNRLEDNAIEKLWICLQDLFHRDIPKEHRHLAFSFFRCLIQGQYEKLGLMRVHFFRLVKEHDVPEDVGPRLELLQSLTENGKDILYFEEEVGPFLLQWMSDMTGIGKTHEFLSMLVNVIKFNAAYVDEDVIAGLVLNTCYLCCCSNSQQVVLTCLQVLDTVVCYSNLPSDSLPTFISALCRTVNVEAFCQSSWKIMRNLLGTHMGHSALYTMCRILQEPSSLQDIFLLRGAVFYISMGLWGTKPVTTLKHKLTSVLPSFLHALESKHSVVMYEVILSIQRLINKYGLELHEPSWDVVLKIIETIIDHIEPSSHSASVSLITSHLHDTICTIEQLIERRQFNGSVHRVFELIERCSPVRPESSVLRLITYLAGSIVPTRSLWLTKLNSLLDQYYKQESRTNIRVKVLDILSHVIHINRALYEDELIERVVVPHLQHIDADPDIVVRNAAAQLLVDLCLECDNKRCLELLDILEKLLNRPFEQYTTDAVTIVNESEVTDVKTTVVGLIKVLKFKLYQLPSTHAIRVYKLLVNHLEAHYHKPAVFENTSSIRYTIFECFLQLRANSLYHLGFPKPNSSELHFSPYLTVDHKNGERPGGSVSPPPMSPAPSSHPQCTVTHLSLTHACKAVITCLKQEKDWKVLHLILKELPQVMQNKALILSRHGNDVDLLATALIAMVSDKSLALPDCLRNTPLKFTRSEFHSHVFPVLTSLSSYHAYLESTLQQRLIKCLEFGLMSRCACQCVTALTICTLEMRDAMYKLLPEVLLNLSKISATVHIAIPILEFLSTLTRLPKVFASFVGDQYMAVFAISLPFTNPFKYNHYTVSLAHHVIAVWFLKCRLPFRRDFVKFITTGLKANVIVPFEEGQIMKPDIINEDSSSRKRSSSLTEQGSRHSVRSLAAANRPVDLKPPIDESLMNFHVELTETCIDLMARYTFSTCSALPKRLPTAEFLLNGGQSMTWLLGNKLISVTTSGCSQKALKNGLCDKCWALCRQDKEPTSPDNILEQEGSSTFRRSKTTVQRSIAPVPGKDEPAPNVRLTRQLSEAGLPRTAPNVNNTATSSPTDETKKTFNLQETHEPEPSKLDQLLFGSKEIEKQEQNYCACWCQGWAEIYVRRPTGDMSWVMRIQNHNNLQNSLLDFPLADISTLFMPAETSKKEQQFEDYVSGHKRINSENLAESDYDAILDQHFEQGVEMAARIASGTAPICIPGSPCPSRQDSQDNIDVDEQDLDDGVMVDLEEGGKSRNPVRRSNSSPEMSASWKNAFMNREKERDGQAEAEGVGNGLGGGENQAEGKKSVKQTYSKDPRVSCEAIPEEINSLGTTPPAGDAPPVHPSLLSCHSYPGAVAQLVSPPLSGAAGRRPSTQQTPLPVIQPVSSARPPQSPSLVCNSTDINKANPPSLRESKLPSDARQPLTVDTKIGPRQQTTPLGTPTSAVSDKALKEELPRPDPSTLPPLTFKRDRGHTISVMSPVRKPRPDWSSIKRDNSPRSKDSPRSGISPSFVFLQLYHTTHFGSTTEKPLLVSQSQVVQRAFKNLDRIPPYETHKVGVIYVGPGQANNETEILRNQFGSLRYTEFLQRLGTLIKLKDADPQNTFLGGLERNGNDGKFAYIWQDDVMQVTFHVATLMPTKDSDPLCNDKKRHIGNDYVTIVYNESGEEYNVQTLKAQFQYAWVIVQPLDHNTNQVIVKTREELAEHIGHSDPKMVSDQNVAILARQLALHVNLASVISCSLKAQGQDPYASNWLERLRQIKRLRCKIIQETASSTNDNNELLTSPRSSRRVHMDDFTEYT
ncbi:tuberin isoform X2 [Anabrus simplex]|uniref:tuberin isoform X2 n=1 Tax=Anabrus simplex TaxID=316456 RepID=UPI0035A29DF4